MLKRNKFLRLVFLLPIFIAVGSYTLQAQSNSNFLFIPTRIEEDFEISAELSNPLWQQAEPLFIKYEVAPNPQQLAPVKTKIKVLYSADNLYIAFIAYDPNPEKIRAQIADRDEVFSNDYVGIIMDTFGNNQQAYGFFINPRGIQIDTYRISGRSADVSFDTIWYSKGAVTDSGYVAVMKIPFKSLNFPEKKYRIGRFSFFVTIPARSAINLAGRTYSSIILACCVRAVSWLI